MIVELMPENLLIGTLASFVANFLSALAGGGSGLFLLPALLFMGLPFHTALATHKIATVGLGVGAATRHSQESKLNFKFCLYLLSAGVPGVIIGAYFASHIPESFGKLLLGLLIMLITFIPIHHADNLHLNDRDRSRSSKIYGAIGIFVIGLINGALTSGTGLLFTFWLVKWFNLGLLRALAYTMFICSLAYNAVGALIMGTMMTVNWNLLPYLLIGAFFGGYIGSHFSLLKGEKFVQFCFKFSCLLIGVVMIVAAIEQI